MWSSLVLRRLSCRVRIFFMSASHGLHPSRCTAMALQAVSGLGKEERDWSSLGTLTKIESDGDVVTLPAPPAFSRAAVLHFSLPCVGKRN